MKGSRKESLPHGLDEILSPQTNDVRLDQQALVNSIFEFRRSVIFESDPDSNKKCARELWGLINSERNKISQMRFAGATDQDILVYVDSSEDQGRINELYLQLGLARMLTQHDWRVTRVEELSEGFGVVPLNEVEAIHLRWLKKVGLLDSEEPKTGKRLVHLNAGPGSGIVPHKTRHDTKTDPFGNEHRLKDYFMEVSLGDLVYFTLGDVLQDLVREEFRKDPAFLEFLDFVTTLILRKIYNLTTTNRNFKDKPLTSAEEILLQLPSNPNRIRDILGDLNVFIRSFSRQTKYKGDREFLGDHEVKVSSECSKMREQYLQNPQAFLRKYFSEELDANSPVDLKRRIRIYPHNLILGKFENISDKFFKQTFDRQVDPAVSSPAREKFLAETEKIFDVASSYRSSSHLDLDWKSVPGDSKYGIFIRDLCKRMKKGGIILDDGFRQSYTRFERIEWLQRIAHDLGPDFRFLVVYNDSGPKSILIQRSSEMEEKFYDNEELSSLLRDGCQVLDLADYWRKWPERKIRNNVVDAFRRGFAKKAQEVFDRSFRAHEAEKNNALLEGRDPPPDSPTLPPIYRLFSSSFRGLQRDIDKSIEPFQSPRTLDHVTRSSRRAVRRVVSSTRKKLDNLLDLDKLLGA